MSSENPDNNNDDDSGSELYDTDSSKAFERQEFERQEPANQGFEGRRERHGFTTFWLVFCLASNVFACILSLEFVNDPEIPRGRVLLLLINQVTVVFGYIMLLYWEKKGFLLIAGAFVVTLFVNIFTGTFEFVQLFGALGIFILWKILNIGKNGKTAWGQMT